MARPRTGSVTQRGNVWRASVPTFNPAKPRLESTFPTEKAARSWVKAQLARVEQGLEPQLPKRRQAPNLSKLPPSTFSEVARRWYDERYVALQHGDGGRRSDVERNMRLHIVPAFADLFTLEVLDGRARIIDWLRVLSGRRALTPDSPLRPGSTTYSKTTVTGFLWILKEVIAYAREIGLDVPEYVKKKDAMIRALKPVGRRKRHAQLLTMDESRLFAARLHWIYQLAFWIMRLSGLRISEAYGLRIENFIRDVDGDGFLRVKEQGGRAFLTTGEDDQVVSTSTKQAVKTDAAYRLIALPRLLVDLIQYAIDVWHTDDDGCVDGTARLIPTIRSETGGQAGFHSAIKKAAYEMGVATGDEGDEALEDLLIPHDLRKAFATDLAWDKGISDLLARRSMGHRAGSDVYDLVYTLDPRLKESLLPIARSLEADLAREGVTTLMVPTTLRPVFGREQDDDRIARVYAELAKVGWLVPTDAERITVAEAAVLLGYTEKHTRRLMGTHIPAIKTSKSWLVRVEDVVAFRDRLDGMVLLRELAEEAGVPYRKAHRYLTNLWITPLRDTYDERVILLTKDQAATVIEYFAHERERARHSVTRARAAELLGVTPSIVEQLLQSGHLVAFEEGCDELGVRIAMDSIEQELARRKRRGRSLSQCANRVR